MVESIAYVWNEMKSVCPTYIYSTGKNFALSEKEG